MIITIIRRKRRKWDLEGKEENTLERKEEMKKKEEDWNEEARKKIRRELEIRHVAKGNRWER